MNVQIFKDHAPEYAAHGLTVFPVGKDKRPLVKNWLSFKPGTVKNLVDQLPFADANIGVLDGQKIVRVDIDDSSLCDDAVARFGDTPVKVRTPRGGMHLWYRASGERRIIGLDGMKLDILGTGGYGVAPPSVLSSGACYEFIEGSLADIDGLPPIAPGALPEAANLNTAGSGQRNNRIFKAACRRALSADNVDELAAYLQILNEAECDPPLDEAELQRIVQSAWGYRQKGCLKVGADIPEITHETMRAFAGRSMEWQLYCWAVAYHSGRREQFALAQEPLSEVLGCDRKTLRAAISGLIDMGFLERIHVGKGRGDPHIYCFRPRVKFPHNKNTVVICP